MGGPNNVPRDEWRDARKALLAELVRLRNQFDAGLGLLAACEPAPGKKFAAAVGMLACRSSSR